jgi:hypothetical protein
MCLPFWLTARDGCVPRHKTALGRVFFRAVAGTSAAFACTAFVAVSALVAVSAAPFN